MRIVVGMVSFFPCASTMVSDTAWMVRIALSRASPPLPRTARAISASASSRCVRVNVASPEPLREGEPRRR